MRTDKTDGGRLISLATAVAIVFISGNRWCHAFDAYPILLQNDEIVYGKLERLPGQYRIRFENRSFAVVRRHQVQFAGPDLAAIYEYKLKHASPKNAVQHHQLAEWCLQHRLMAETEKHIDEAQTLGAAKDDVERLRERLNELRTPSTSRVALANFSVADSALPVGRGRQSANAPPPDVSNVTRAVELQKFMHDVQPILLKSCGAAHCHGYASHSAFRVRRPPRSLRPSRSITMHNLSYAKMQLGQFTSGPSALAPPAGDAPSIPLVEYALQAHGKMKAASIQRNSREHKSLAAWAAAASGRALDVAPRDEILAQRDTAIAARTGKPGPRMEPPPRVPSELPDSGRGPGRDHARPAVATEPLPSTGSLPDRGSRVSRQDPELPVPPSDDELLEVPVDPFDPAIYNSSKK